MYPSSFQRNAPASESDYPTQCKRDESINHSGWVELSHTVESLSNDGRLVPGDFRPNIQSDGALRNYGPGMAAIPAQQYFDPFSSGAYAGAAQVYFPEMDTLSLSYASSTQGSPTPTLLSPRLDGYQRAMAGLKGSSSHFFAQDQYTDSNNTVQLDSYLQLTDFGTTGQLYAHPPFAGAVKSQDQVFVDPKTLPNNMIPAYPSTSLLPTSPPAQGHSQILQIPSLDHASRGSATSLSPVAPTLGTIVEIDVPPFHPEIVEPKPRLAWMQPEEPQLVEICQSPLAKASQKRTVESAGMVDHSYGTAAPTNTHIGPRSAKQSRTSASRAETTVEALDINTIDSKASSYKGHSSASSAAGDLRVSVAGPSYGPLATPRPGKPEELTWEQWIKWLRSLENKDLKPILITTEKILGEDKSKCCWEGCTNRPRKRPWDVLRHIRTAHLEQYAMCNLCHKVFKREDSKRRHMRTEHPQQYAACTIGNSRRGDGKSRRRALKADRG